MPTTDTPQPLAVDYSGRPLTEGDPVAFLSHDPIGLTVGHICVIRPESICIETGPHLVTFNGTPASLGMRPPRPVAGTVTRDESVQEPFRYSQVALQSAATDPKNPELTAQEARDLADQLGTDLYWAQDRIAFVGECCDIADREQRVITTADVRQWLKGARCGRQMATEAASKATEGGT